MIKYIPVLILFIVGLLYILAPIPDSVHDFPAIPYAIKSQLEGDTIQNPNNKAYFSDWQRSQITQFYKQEYQDISYCLPLLVCPFEPITLNHPPEDAFRYVRDQEDSTFLEEYVYPLKGSIFVNGYEAKVALTIPAKAKYVPYDHVPYDGGKFVSKTTLRYYNAPLLWRVTVYVGIWVALFFMFNIAKEAFFKQEPLLHNQNKKEEKDGRD